MGKFYLYTFKDNDSNDSYCFITKHDCKQLLQDIEDYWYDINEVEDNNEIIEILQNYNADIKIIEFIKKQGENLNLSSAYEFEKDILEDLGELISFEEETFYY